MKRGQAGRFYLRGRGEATFPFDLLGKNPASMPFFAMDLAWCIIWLCFTCWICSKYYTNEASLAVYLLLLSFYQKVPC